MTDATLLHRQVHPSWIRDGVPTRQMFRPTRKDDHRLSVYDGDQITAEAAWRHYTQAQHRRSVGVMSVTRRECRDTGLRVIGDGTPFPEHAVIEFSGLSRNETKTAAAVLAAAARRRGWQYRVS